MAKKTRKTPTCVPNSKLQSLTINRKMLDFEIYSCKGFQKINNSICKKTITRTYEAQTPTETLQHDTIRARRDGSMTMNMS